ncbi:hypothetical protein NA56DRAFT_698298 [Hyaloscypha hepaticicola]|uniref:Uncharacterized protein n=1 Tax=Hyaloscypha hepaticicola TaxID=2082293 RepID=A0A2J6QIQ8_9HELO|nr:hypothetical protein NA56DRAFT_698298 [Hyaloscypha hepaticicola]
MNSARASGSDAFVFVQHMSRISEPSYSDSSSACPDSGFGTGGHRSATRFTNRRRHAIDANDGEGPQRSIVHTPQPAVSYVRKWRTESAKCAAGPGQGFNLFLVKSKRWGLMDYQVTRSKVERCSGELESQIQNKKFLNAVGSGPFSHLLSLAQGIVRECSVSDALAAHAASVVTIGGDWKPPAYPAATTKPIDDLVIAALHRSAPG